LTSPTATAVVAPGCGPNATVSSTAAVVLLSASEKLPESETPGIETETSPPISPARPPPVPFLIRKKP